MERTLIGKAASRGEASGPARIVRGVDDCRAVKAGDILIAEMTRPEYMPAMQRAAGFATAVGGVTCHAAIVARELGIPCVVAVGSDLLTVKDGAPVAINANGTGKVTVCG